MKQKITLYLLLVSALAGRLSMAQPIILPTSVDSIPMRDGKKLAADVFLPPGNGPFPVILIQTPYNRLFYRSYLPLNVGTNMQNFPYAFVITDWRGFFGSISAAAVGANQGDDGYDTVDWIAQQNWCNGKVGTYGLSALGRVQFVTAQRKHPAHKCMVPIVAAPQYAYQTFYEGGIKRTEYIQQLNALGFSGLASLVNQNIYQNALWNFSFTQTFFPQDIEIPTLMIAGWFDHAIRDQLQFFQALKTSAPMVARDKHRLLVGPYTHSGTGYQRFDNAQQGVYFFPDIAESTIQESLQFFDYYLRDVANAEPNSAAVKLYEIHGQQWLEGGLSLLQAPKNQTLYLHGEQLSPVQSLVDGSRSVGYNPLNPSPTIGGATLQANLLQGPYNQAEVEQRSDALVFTTESLPLNISGNMEAIVYVSSQTPDTDVALRLTEVLPNGESILIAEGIRRLRFRNGFALADVQLAQANEVYELRIELPPLQFKLREGHRLRLVLSGSNYPRFDANDNSGGPMYVPGDTLENTITLHANGQYLSRLQFAGSMLTSVNEAAKLQWLKLSPNPGNGLFHLSEPLPDGTTYQVLNALGQRVKSGQVVQAQIHIQNLTAGIYYIQFKHPMAIKPIPVLIGF